MKLRTTVGSLLSAYAIAHPTLDRKGAASNLYLQANEASGFLYLYSTNLISETATKIKAEIEKAGEVLVNPSKLSDGLIGLGKETPITLELTPTGNQLKVQAGKVKFSLAASIDVKELGNRMRSIPSKVAPAAKVPATELAEFTRRSVFCIPNDQTGQRATLSTLKISDMENGGEEAFATDGSIVVHVSSEKKQSKGTIGTGILIPAQALQPLSALVTKNRGQTVGIVLNPDKNKVYFKFADGTYYGALTMATQFPNLKSLLEKTTDFSVSVVREALKQTLSRANAFVTSGTTKKGLELEFGQESLSIRANGDDALSDEVAITYVGKEKPTEPIKLGMDIDYLANIVASSHSESLTLGFSKENQPLIVTDTEGDEDERINSKYIVMSMRS